MLLLSDLSYDLVLMRSDDGEQFAAYLYEWLTADARYQRLEVFRYDEDVLFGSREYNRLVPGLCIMYIVICDIVGVWSRRLLLLTTDIF